MFVSFFKIILLNEEEGEGGVDGNEQEDTNFDYVLTPLWFQFVF